MDEVLYTSDQLVLCLTKKNYHLESNPRRGRWYFKHKSNNKLKGIIIPVGRNDLNKNYVKIWLKNTNITFTEFKKMI